MQSVIDKSLHNPLDDAIIMELDERIESEINIYNKAELLSDKTKEIQLINQKFICSSKKLCKASYLKLFRFATAGELCRSFLGIILTSLAAFGLPYNVVLYGEFTTLLIDRNKKFGTSTPTILLPLFGGGELIINGTIEENQLALLDDSKAFGIGCVSGAILQFIILSIGINLINGAALRQISRIRKLFFYSMLRQDMTWYDTVSDCNFSTRITEDLDKIKDGMADKLGVFIYLIMSFIICFVLAFVYGWKLTLVILSCSPLIIIATAVVAKVQSSLTIKELQSYSLAGRIAEEVFGAIKTVIAFGGERLEVDRYKGQLKEAELNGKRKGAYSGLGSGILWMIIYCSYALTFWYGIKLIIDSNNVNNIDANVFEKEYTPAVLVIVLFGVLIGAQNLGLTSPHIEAFASAVGAANIIYKIIERQPEIDAICTTGECLSNFAGEITFQNVNFRYPSRGDVDVLNNLSFSAKAGQTLAIVGPSGSGKSTVLQLIQRLYDPIEGSIEVDGKNIKNLNASSWRSRIGVVRQEPTLFSETIADNISYGNLCVSQKEIEKVARIANCHFFIKKLPDGYDTVIGSRGGQLSGGQKQRIAIARALISDPKILLLDEATSALDYNSERLVQKALNKASQGRTTIVVSHRLSALSNVDHIIYMENGTISEQGSYEELMKKKGLYYNLVNASQSNDQTEKEKSSTNSSLYSSSQFSDIESDVQDEQDEEKQQRLLIQQNQKQQQQQKSQHNAKKMSMWKILRLNSPEWHLILLGCIACIINGSALSICAILFGEFYGLLSLSDMNEIQEKSNEFSLLFVALGLMTGIAVFFQTFLINIAGVRLTSRLRQLVFQNIIKQDISWFDDTNTNSVGTICARLSDCAKVQGATGSRLATILQSLSTLLIGIAISFYFSWKLTIVSIGAIPLVFAACFFESRYMGTSNLEEKYAMEHACQIATEAIANIRTIVSLNQEMYVFDRFKEALTMAERGSRRKIGLRGCVYALGQTAPLFGYALALYYGGILVANEEITYENVIKVSEALITGSWMLGVAIAYAPDVNSALSSAGHIINLLNLQPPSSKCCKTVTIKSKPINMVKCYPNRPNMPILEDFSLDIKSGHTIALVGQSGCGKSTCLQLLLRYYEPIGGCIALDGQPITDLPIEYLRSNISIVSQEPVLFERSIFENIAYGDNSRIVSLPEIISIAKKANIHQFISSLPLGYETLVGNNGSQLSGGQKQRIAIARALIRNPKLLLLDEATSALDIHSETIVQDTLDLARSGRTCIIVAHRLSTIKNVDIICVMENGKITEMGTHDELLKQNGAYSKLYAIDDK